MTQILILNGPNLNLLGTREPGIYGAKTLPDVEADCHAVAAELGITVRCAQSNHEGTMVDEIHAARDTCAGVVINAGAYTHTSIALHDAIAGTGLPVIEVHISNVYAREEFRHHSMIARACIGVIAGLGTAGYELALRAMTNHLKAGGP
ncbi:3-dehydroquinate dehydratase [Thalassobacter stenotrophicus]|uniref:type II 3-dehydroquinate dehydratase n=1 Tax=Thalassobacter TaxID=266808 RepID=UPI00051D2567|nr:MULTISPECIES: type II 3-dehydroquinate dehydratase [Thalassobacter]KGK79844.1 3-dehydroquinate dehydratase [Thalassobacter stenotrophicus]KGL02652.1 3-dehydroquinate dehydratase [Thalassobacter sp. 16PALIMAR09]